jgi:DNA polymerase-3 subunit alpha
VREEEAPKILCDSFSRPQAQRAREEKKDKDESKNGLYISVNSIGCVEYEKACHVAAVFDGEFPLYVYCRDTKKLMRAPRQMWVSMNLVLETELKSILGEENVFVRN